MFREVAFSPSKYWADLLANRKQHAPRGAQWMPFLPLSALLIKLNLGKFFYVHINFSSPCRIWSLQNKIRWLKHKHLIKYLQIWSATVERHHNIQSSADTWKLWAEIEMMQQGDTTSSLKASDKDMLFDSFGPHNFCHNIFSRDPILHAPACFRR